MTSRSGSTLPPAELKSPHITTCSGIINCTRDVALAFGVLWYLGYCEYPTIGRFGGPKTDPTKTWYPGPQTEPLEQRASTVAARDTPAHRGLGLTRSMTGTRCLLATVTVTATQ